MQDQKSVQVNFDYDDQAQDNKEYLLNVEDREQIDNQKQQSKAVQYQDTDISPRQINLRYKELLNKQNLQVQSYLSQQGENIIQRSQKLLSPVHSEKKLNQQFQNINQQERQIPLQYSNKRVELVRNSYQPSTYEELKLQRQYDKLFNGNQNQDFQSRIREQKIKELDNQIKQQQQAREFEERMKQEKVKNQIMYREQLSDQLKKKMELQIQNYQNIPNDQQISYEEQMKSIFRKKQQQRESSLRNEVHAKTKQKTSVFNPITFQQQEFQMDQNNQFQYPQIKSLGNVHLKDKATLPQFEEKRLITPNRNYYKRSPFDTNSLNNSQLQNQQISQEIQVNQQIENQENQLEEKQNMSQLSRHQEAYLKSMIERKNNPFEPVLTGQYKINQIIPPANKEVKFTNGVFYPDTTKLLQ